MRKPAERIAKDRETHQRDLFEAIERGDFPKWKFSVQIMPEGDIGKHWYNPFDLTKARQCGARRRPFT